MTRLSQRRILLLLLITPLLLVLELVIGSAVYSGIQTINIAQEKHNRFDAYIRTNTKNISLAESAQRGYLLTGDTRFRDSFYVYMHGIAKNEAAFDTLQNETRNEDVTTIRSISAHKISEMARTISLHDAGMKDSSVAMVRTGNGKLMMDSIRQRSGAVRSHITEQIADQKSRQEQLFMYAFVLIVVLILINIYIVWFTYRQFSNYTNQLESTVQSLEEANKRMSAYTTQSYHELKTPLRNIHGFAQLLKNRYSHVGEEETEEDEFIQYITDGIRQMNRTIDQLRDRYLGNIVDKK